MTKEKHPPQTFFGENIMNPLNIDIATNMQIQASATNQADTINLNGNKLAGKFTLNGDYGRDIVEISEEALKSLKIELVSSNSVRLYDENDNYIVLNGIESLKVRESGRLFDISSSYGQLQFIREKNQLSSFSTSTGDPLADNIINALQGNATSNIYSTPTSPAPVSNDAINRLNQGTQAAMAQLGAYPQYNNALPYGYGQQYPQQQYYPQYQQPVYNPAAYGYGYNGGLSSPYQYQSPSPYQAYSPYLAPLQGRQLSSLSTGPVFLGDGQIKANPNLLVGDSTKCVECEAGKKEQPKAAPQETHSYKHSPQPAPQQPYYDPRYFAQQQNVYNIDQNYSYNQYNYPFMPKHPPVKKIIIPPRPVKTEVNLYNKNVLTNNNRSGYDW